MDSSKVSFIRLPLNTTICRNLSNSEDTFRIYLTVIRPDGIHGPNCVDFWNYLTIGFSIGYSVYSGNNVAFYLKYGNEVFYVNNGQYLGIFLNAGYTTSIGYYIPPTEVRGLSLKDFKYMASYLARRDNTAHSI